MALPTIFDTPNKNLVRGNRLVRLQANGTVVIPAGVLLRRIYFRNRTANAVSGGIKIGTTSGGTELVTAQAVAGSAIVSAIPTLEAYSTSTQTLYIQAVTGWNSADVDVRVHYEEITTRTQPSQNTVQA